MRSHHHSRQRIVPCCATALHGKCHDRVVAHIRVRTALLARDGAQHTHELLHNGIMLRLRHDYSDASIVLNEGRAGPMVRPVTLFYPRRLQIIHTMASPPSTSSRSPSNLRSAKN